MNHEFDFDAVINQVWEQCYALLAGLPMLLLAALVLWLSLILGRWLSRRALVVRLADRNPLLRELTRTSVRWAVAVVGILIALEILDATALVGAVLGTAGVLGVALGFAFKDTLENYLAGILMSLRQPFAARDYVVIDGNEGTVVALTSRATILMTPDGNHLRLPNALVFRSVTLNYTRNPSRRFSFDIGIGVNEDLLRAQAIGVEVLSKLDGVKQEPPPRAFIASLGDSNVQVRILAWVDQRSHDFALVRSEGIRLVKTALEDAQMDLPEPIYRVQINDLSKPGQTTPKPRVALSDAASPAPDTRTHDDLNQQIEQDLREHSGQDLLSPEAPRE